MTIAQVYLRLAHVMQDSGGIDHVDLVSRQFQPLGYGSRQQHGYPPWRNVYNSGMNMPRDPRIPR